MLVNSAIYNNFSPTNTRKLISVSEKKKPSDKTKKEKKISVNNTKSLQVKDTKDELAIYGKVHYSINEVVTYFLSKHNRTHMQSLVDRRVNNRVIEIDIRIISLFFPFC